MQIQDVSDAWLWRGLNRNGDALGQTLLCIRICTKDAAIDRLNEELNDLLGERAQLNAELWRRR